MDLARALPRWRRRGEEGRRERKKQKVRVQSERGIFHTGAAPRCAAPVDGHRPVRAGGRAGGEKVAPSRLLRDEPGHHYQRQKALFRAPNSALREGEWSGGEEEGGRGGEDSAKLAKS